MALKRLYHDWVRAVRSLEISRIVQIAGLLGVVAMALLGEGVRASEAAQAVVGSVLTLTFLLSARSAHRKWLSAARRHGKYLTPVVLIGVNDEGFGLYRLLTDQPELGYRVCGLIGDAKDTLRRDYEVPWLGDSADAVDAVRTSGASQVLLASGAMTLNDVNHTVHELLQAGLPVHVSSALPSLRHRRLHVQPLGSAPLFSFEPPHWSELRAAGLGLVLGRGPLPDNNVPNEPGVAPLAPTAQPVRNLASRRLHWRSKRAPKLAETAHETPLISYQRLGKPVLDYAVALGAAALLLPVILMLCLAVRVSMGRPVFFKQARVGHHGRIFRVWKFRTMLPDRRSVSRVGAVALERRVTHKSPNDPRLTPVGKFLRKWSLDELPQLWNVLRGEMSLVGPRPELPFIVQAYKTWQHRRHLVKPGLTGLWQISERGGEVLMHENPGPDLEYVERVSFALDLKILFLTLPAALGVRRGY